MPVSIAQLRRQFKRLQKLTVTGEIHGAETHQMRVGKPATPRAVAAFEEVLGVSLPEDFREVLLQWGDGGAGPGNGVMTLAAIKALCTTAGDVGLLQQPFPFTVVHSLGSDDEPGEADGVDLSAEEFRLTPGGLPLADYGFGITALLALQGPESGNVWFESRLDGREYFPATPASAAYFAGFEEIAGDALDEGRLQTSDWLHLWMTQAEEWLTLVDPETWE